jgi:hypothetical protein
MCLIPLPLLLTTLHRFQHDYDGIAHLRGVAADGLHLPRTRALGDEPPSAVEGVSEACRSQHHSGQHHHGGPDARQPFMLPLAG